MENNHFQFASLNGNKIIKYESALIPQFVEGHIFCKKDVEDKIISAIKPITEGKHCENLFIYGPIGSGKTILVKHILDHLKDYNRKVLCVYINCWYHGTSMAIYNRIAEELGEPVSRRGRATDEIFDRIIEIMKKSNMPILLVLDDIEAILYRGDERILHNIAVIEDQAALFGVVIISQNKANLWKLHPKIKTGLRFISIEVKGCTKEQLLSLLKNRAEKGLFEEAYDDAVLERIAEIGENNEGNGKLTLEILRRASKLAESKGKTCIDLEDVEEVNNQLGHKELILTKEEEIIINILKTGEKNSSELYWLFCKKLRRSKKQIRVYLKYLEEKGIIETREFNSKYTFNSRLIKLKNGVI